MKIVSVASVRKRKAVDHQLVFDMGDTHDSMCVSYAKKLSTVHL